MLAKAQHKNSWHARQLSLKSNLNSTSVNWLQSTSSTHPYSTRSSQPKCKLPHLPNSTMLKNSKCNVLTCSWKKLAHKLQNCKGSVNRLERRKLQKWRLWRKPFWMREESWSVFLKKPTMQENQRLILIVNWGNKWIMQTRLKLL